MILPLKTFLSPWGWLCADPIMSFNTIYENSINQFNLIIPSRCLDPDPGSGCSDRIRIPTCQNTRIRPDPDPKHCIYLYLYLSIYTSLYLSINIYLALSLSIYLYWFIYSSLSIYLSLSIFIEEYLIPWKSFVPTWHRLRHHFLHPGGSFIFNINRSAKTAFNR